MYKSFLGYMTDSSQDSDSKEYNFDLTVAFGVKLNEWVYRTEELKNAARAHGLRYISNGSSTIIGQKLNHGSYSDNTYFSIEELTEIADRIKEYGVTGEAKLHLVYQR
jgi:hypothetical protein